ncbi:MAG: type II secretion system F family protein [Kineosporiaceae bacterium]|nr:type II secretion system F family protein [Aeromicrobium sp.]
MTGALIGFVFATGVVLAYRGWARNRRPALTDRLLPYLRDVHPQSVAVSSSQSAAAAVFGPYLQRGARTVGNVLGGSASVASRLNRLGTGQTVEQFRIRQVVWGLCGFGGCAAVSVLWLAGRGSASVSLLVLCVAGFVGGVLGCDNALTSTIRVHERRMSEEFPTVADLLALAVAAGEGPVTGLERVVRVCHGDLASELSRVLADIRTGMTVQRAFDGLAGRTGVASIARFAEGLAVAIERGTPLVDVLHAQAADVRESSRRELIEAGGRKEVAMMIPVVFFILPVTIVFAFFPGYIGLHMTSGM